jgi:hypothetical protein
MFKKLLLLENESIVGVQASSRATKSFLIVLSHVFISPLTYIAKIDSVRLTL